VLAAIAVTACIALPGCSRHSWGGGGQSSGGVKAGGIKFDYVIEHLTCGGRGFLVLVAGRCSGRSEISGPTSEGRLRTVDGRQIAWSCRTQDGRDGTVTVDGQSFDLAKGAMFLVSAREIGTKVEQLAVDKSKLQGGNVEDKMNAAGETEPRI